MLFRNSAHSEPDSPRHLSDDGTSCRHCGGEVGEDGYAKNMAEGGEAGSGEFPMGDGNEPGRMGVGGEGWEQEEREPTETLNSEQRNGTLLMRNSAFIDAIRRRRGNK